jgi:hypothetical protein
MQTRQQAHHHDAASLLKPLLLLLLLMLYLNHRCIGQVLRLLALSPPWHAIMTWAPVGTMVRTSWRPA